MIRKLLVLNGSEGHKFEVGKQYTNNTEIFIVKKITGGAGGGYRVLFEGTDEYVDVISNNVMVFKTN